MHRQLLAESGAAGIVYGNSGGKDSALVGILCKAACENTVGLLLPCTSKRNYAEDRADAETVAAQYRIETRTVDLTPVKAAALAALDGVTTPNAPRARQFGPAAADADAVRGRRVGKPPRRRHRQPQRGVCRLFHEMGRRRA